MIFCRVKKSKEKNIRTIEEIKNEELAEKIQLKQQIKSQQKEAEEKRKKLFEEKREKARLENERRIEEENRLDTHSASFVESRPIKN